MIGALCLIAVGAFGALYFTHKTFRDRIHDLCSHVKSLFVKDGPKPVTQATEASSSNTVTTTAVVTPTTQPSQTVSS